jgi:Zn-dependent protease with chaperone function
VPGIPAVLHDPTTGRSRRVTVAWEAAGEGVLRVDGPDAPPPAPAAALRLRRGGWRGGAVHLVWPAAGGEWAVTVDEPAAVAALLAGLPPRFGEEVARWRRAAARRRRGGRVALAAAAALLLLPLVGLALLWTFRDALLDAAVRRLPASVDARLGDAVHAQLRAGGRLAAGGPAREAVRAIGERLVAAAPPHPFAFRFEVLDDPAVNAFAAPGGVVVVHTGLLAAAGAPEEVAGVLAHEVVHVLARHSLRQVLVQLGLATTLRLLAGGEGLADALGSAAARLGALGFSRGQEREADAGALDLLRGARLPADGLAAFFERLAAEGGAPPAFLSSHPAGADRAAALRAELARRGPWPVEPLAIDWAAVRTGAGGGG